MNHRVGKAGEHAVASQLLLRGADVYFPSYDYGVDLLTSNGCRIQVKSAHLNASAKMIDVHGEGTYSFGMTRTKRLAVSRDRAELRKKLKPSEFCDVVVFWGIDQNRFWIIPASLADGTQCFNLGRAITPRFVGNIADVREMLALGYTHDKIATHYGVARTLITQILHRPGFISQDASATAKARACENAWETILNFIPTREPRECTGVEVREEQLDEQLEEQLKDKE
jgi:hypothetical protein